MGMLDSKELQTLINLENSYNLDHPSSPFKQIFNNIDKKVVVKGIEGLKKRVSQQKLALKKLDFEVLEEKIENNKIKALKIQNKIHLLKRNTNHNLIINKIKK